MRRDSHPAANRLAVPPRPRAMFIHQSSRNPLTKLLPFDTRRPRYLQRALFNFRLCTVTFKPVDPSSKAKIAIPSLAQRIRAHTWRVTVKSDAARYIAVIIVLHSRARRPSICKYVFILMHAQLASHAHAWRDLWVPYFHPRPR